MKYVLSALTLALAAATQERQRTNLFKAWFPDLATARKAAVSLHDALLETEYERGWQIFELDAEQQALLQRFGYRLEPARDFISRRDAYLKATETVQPDVWKRKLRVLVTSAADEQMRLWAGTELQDIENFAALDALYRETLKVAAQLTEPHQVQAAERAQARIRYNQLYWADLPFAGESPAVASAMVEFRNQLLKAEQSPPDSPDEWNKLNGALIRLSQALRESMPKPTLPKPANPK